MGFFSGPVTYNNVGDFHAGFAAFIESSAGWTVTQVNTTDPNGYRVTVVHNVDNDFDVVLFHNDPASITGAGAFVLAESYDPVAGTVTNPASQGSFGPLTGDVAFAAPVALSALTNASFAGPPGATGTTTSSNSKIVNAVTTRNILSIGYDVRVGLPYRGVTCTMAAATPVSPSIESAPVLWQGSYNTTIGFGEATGYRYRINRTPLSSTYADATSWDTPAIAWHTFASYGTDAYSIEPSAKPITDYALYRTAGDTDGRGVLRAYLPDFRAGTGTDGEEVTDADGTVWRYRDGDINVSSSSTPTTKAAYLPGWWKVV